MQTAANIWWLIRHNWVVVRILGIALVLTGIITTAIPAVTLSLTKDAINLLTDTPFQLNTLFLLIAAQYGLQWVMAVVSLVSDLVRVNLRDKLALNLKNHLLHCIHKLPLEYVESSGFSNQVQRCEVGVSRATQTLLTTEQFVQSIFQTLSYFIVLARSHYYLAFFSLILALPQLWFDTSIARRRFTADQERFTLEQEGHHIFRLLTSDAQKELRLFNSSDYFMEKWRSISDQVLRWRFKQVAYEKRKTLVMYVISKGLEAALTLYLVMGIVNGLFTPGDYVAGTAAIGGVFNAVKGMSSIIASLKENDLYIAEVREFIGRIHPDRNRESGRQLPFRRSLKLTDVQFHYPRQNNIVLKDINLEIKAGERIAIVGENGSGKTTLVKVICGLYSPSSGTVQVDGIDLRSGRLRAAGVFQDYARYQLSLRENIAAGNVGALQDDTALLKALKAVGLEDIITHAPSGLDTRLGRLFPKSMELSGGQWQRVALARAYISEPDLLVLDEPTSALDPISELEILRAFLQLFPGKTVVVVSHRLGVTRFVDRIVVLKDGKIVESGSHEELLSLKGEYCRLWSAQAQWYQERSENQELISSAGGASSQ